MNSRARTATFFGLLLLSLFPAPSGKSKEGGPAKPRIAYMGNAIAPFWSIAEKGARDAAAKFNVDLDVRMPQNGATDQKRMVEDLLARGVDGIAISPADPTNQGDVLQAIAAQTHLITQD